MKDIRQELARRLAKSHDLYRRCNEVLAQQVIGTVLLPVPFYVESAKGCRVIDVDGNEYIDVTMGFGPHVLGHAPEVVLDALRAQLSSGLHYGLAHAKQEELARLLTEASPCADTVAFYNSGTEATMAAIRGARAVTGKSKIAVFDGSYHGSHDLVLTETDPQSPRACPRVLPRGAGIPPGTFDQVVYLPFREDAAYDLIRENRNDLAAVLLEPIETTNPRLDVGDFLRGLRDVCTETGALMILDEVVTGFRLAYGGAQEYFGVVPDMACYGKAMGGGMPIGAVGGRRELMETFAFVVDPEARPPRCLTGGTFSGNPMSMVAGTAAVRHLRDHPEIYRHFERQGTRLAAEVNEFCRSQGFAAQMLHAHSMFYLRFQDTEIRNARDIDESRHELEKIYYMYLLKNGVVVPGVHISFLSAAHTADDVTTIIEAMKQSFREMRADGLY